MRPLAVAVAACVFVAALAAMPAARAQGNDTATIYAAVTDKGGKPIKDLTIANFTVAEEGAEKRVLSVEPAGPMSVALLVDRFGEDNTFNVLAVRGAISTMVKTLGAANPDNEFSLTTIDPAAVPQIPFTLSRAEIMKFIDRMAPGVNQAVFLEGIISASKSMASAKYRRRAIVALIAGYKPEGSTIEMSVVAATLRQSGASLWVLEGRSSFGGGSVSSARDAALNVAVPASGGARLSVGVATALETQAKRLAETLVSQYAVTYAAPSAAAMTLGVSVDVKNAKVLAPLWTVR